MKKMTIIFIFVFLLFSVISNVYAINLDSITSRNQINTNNDEDTSIEEDTDDDYWDNLTPNNLDDIISDYGNSQESSYNVSTSPENSSLGLGNVLSIALVVVGILLILLSIAILIRLKG